MITSGLVNLYTADIEAAAAFYGGLLGLEETFRTPAEGVPEHVELAAGGFTVGLGSVEAALRVHGVQASPGTPAMALVLWCGSAADVDETWSRLADAGVPSDREPHDAGNGNRVARVRDPDGNLVELLAKRS